jgi:MFS family permease
LRRRAFRWLWIASFVANIGTWMQTVGAQWLLIEQHSSNVEISLVQSASSLPVLLVTLPAGVVAEFVDRRHMLIAVQGFQVIVGAGLAILTASSHMTANLLLAFTFLLGCGAAAQMPAYQAFVPDLVPRAELGQTAALSSISVNLARAVGPAVAGVLVTRLGVSGLFWLNTASFVVFGLVLLLTPTTVRHPVVRQAFFSSLEAGGRYVWHAPRVRRILLRLVVFVWPANVLWALLAPVASHRLGLGAAGYGLLLGACGVGSIAGALLLPKLRRHLSSSWLTGLAGALSGVAMIGVGTARTPVLVVVALLLAGMAWIAVIASMNAATQAFLPTWVRARALSIYQVVLFSSFATSAAGWGLVSQWIGLGDTFVLAGILLILGAATVRRWPILDADPGSRDTASYWPLPDITLTPAQADDPVLVSIAYIVPHERQSEFLIAMRGLRDLRLRTGGTSWTLLQNALDETSFTEQYTAASWQDHLEQHEHRLTQYDHDVQIAADRLATHVGDAQYLLFVKP